MTRTYPPDIIVTTLYQDITVSPNCGFTKCPLSTTECDSQMVGTQNKTCETINKRHCRSFDFIESLDDPNIFSSSMEYPYTSEQQAVNKDDTLNGIGQQAHLRFSSPDLFNTKLSQQQNITDKTSESGRASFQGNTRSKSAPQVRATFTPVPITVSQTSARRGPSPVYLQKKIDGLPQTREPSLNTNRALINEVHPIKLQSRTPLWVSDCFEENRQEKISNSPHVRYRVDIKPDAAVLNHTTRKPPITTNDLPWQRYSTSSFRSMSMPRQKSTSRTSTPSECYSMDCRQTYSYPNSMPSGYIQPNISSGGISLRNPREYRSLSNPNIPTKFYCTENPTRCAAQPPDRAYFQDDCTRNNRNRQSPSFSGPYMNDPGSQWVFTMPVHTYYADSRRESLDAYYNKPYSVSDIGPHLVSTPQARTYCRENVRTYSFPSEHSNIFYTKSCPSPSDYPIPMKAYHTEGRQHKYLSQGFFDDLYQSSMATYSSQCPSSQATPQKVPAVSPWDTNHVPVPCQLSGDIRNFSRSSENILFPPMKKEYDIPQGKSYENLYHQGRERVSPDNRPVIINLSSSPRRYAALSLSDNSLEKLSSNRGAGMGCHWFVTPEITITDSDISGCNNRKRDGGSVIDGRQAQNTNINNLVRPLDSSEPSGRKHSNSLQQSLEQLDELLADLVIDYKPQNSSQSNEDLIDQLKRLINDEEENEKKVTDKEDSKPLNTQTNSSKNSPDTFKDPDSGCEVFPRGAEDISANHSAEEDYMVCANSKCQHRETLFNASLYFKSCHSCYTYYCSRNCRQDDWYTHKENCLYGRIRSICRHILKHCRENSEVHKAFSRIAKVGYLSRGRGVLFLGFQNPGSADNFLQVGLESIFMSLTYLSLRELDGYKDSLGEYCKELQDAGKEYDPSECFLLNVSIALGDLVPDRPSVKLQAATVRKYAKVSLASSSPDKKVLKKENGMETLILTPPPGTSNVEKEGQEGRKAREICFINIQKELRTRGVFLRHEFPKIYNQLCEFVEKNKRFTPTTIYPIDKRTGKQFMCMIMAATEPSTLDLIGAPHLLDDII